MVGEVLDKIRSEIEQEIIPRNSDRYDHEAKWQNMGLRMALKIIDKNKEEYKRFRELEEDLSSILKKSHLPKGCYYLMVESEGEK